MADSPTKSPEKEKDVFHRLDWRMGNTAWIFLDAILAGSVMLLAFALSPSFRLRNEGDLVLHIGPNEAALCFALLLGVTAHIFELHNPLLPRQFWPMTTRCLGAAMIAVGLIAGLVFAVLYKRIGRLILVQVMVYTPLLMALARWLFWRVTEQRKWRLLLLGTGETARWLQSLVEQSRMPFEIAAFVALNPSDVSAPVGGIPVVRIEKTLADLCQDLRANEIVTCTNDKPGDLILKQLMDCLDLEIRVNQFTSFVEKNYFRVPIRGIHEEWFLYSNLELWHPLMVGCKRLADIAIALLGMVVTSPILGLAMLAIKLESRGAVLHGQIRLGLRNQPFRLWKLRSMRADAEAGGAQWAALNDARVTRVGRVLRRIRLDEIPQFWNVLRGEMSLVGPRPERPEFVEKLAAAIPFYKQRHLTKPGLTGWAQINYPYAATVEHAREKLEYDLYYLKHASAGLDLQILLRTIGAVMRGSR